MLDGLGLTETTPGPLIMVTDSRSEANRKSRSLQPVPQCFGDDRQVSLPGLSNPPTPIAPPSNPLRMSSFLSPKFGAQPTHPAG